MKKGLIFALASLMAGSPAAWAQPGPSSPPKKESPDQSAENLAILNEMQNAGSPLGQAVQDLQKDLESSWQNSKVRRLTEKVKDKAGSALNNYRLDHTFGLPSNLLNRISPLGIEAAYQIIVEPSFQNGEQVRRDVYIFGLAVNKGLPSLSSGPTGASVNGRIQVRMTFSRYFTGDNAKWNAIVAKPYFLNKFPMSASGIKENMKPGETIRVEILGSGGGGLNASQGIANAGVNYVRDALFMMDLYKHATDANKIRVRLFGLKNRGTFRVSAGASVSPWSFGKDRSGVMGLLGRQVEKASRIGVDFSLSKTLDVFHDFPVDTMMVDYLYNFSSSNAVQASADSPESAVNELLANIRRMGYFPLFRLFSNEKDLAQILKTQAALSEKLAQQDFNQDEARKRVKHLFKGRITSDVTTSRVAGSLGRVIGSGSQTVTRMRSEVRSEDTMKKRSFYLLESASNVDELRARLGKTEHFNLNDVDILVRAREDEKGQLRPVALEDVVTTTEKRDRNFSQRDANLLRNGLLASIPTSLQTTEVLNFLPTTAQSNATYRSRFSLGLPAFLALRDVSENEIAQKLFDYLARRPDRDQLGLPSVTPSQNAGYSQYVMELAHLVRAAVDPSTTIEERFSAFHTLTRTELFQVIIAGEFFSTLLPTDQLSKNAALHMDFSSDETPTQEINLGENKSSEAYRLVSFLRSVLNNRSYDLRLETQVNGDGQEMLVTPEIKGFNITINDPK